MNRLHLADRFAALAVGAAAISSTWARVSLDLWLVRGLVATAFVYCLAGLGCVVIAGPSWKWGQAALGAGGFVFFGLRALALGRVYVEQPNFLYATVLHVSFAVLCLAYFQRSLLRIGALNVLRAEVKDHDA